MLAFVLEFYDHHLLCMMPKNHLKCVKSGNTSTTSEHAYSIISVAECSIFVH